MANFVEFCMYLRYLWKLYSVLYAAKRFDRNEGVVYNVALGIVGAR